MTPTHIGLALAALALAVLGGMALLASLALDYMAECTDDLEDGSHYPHSDYDGEA